MLGQFSLFCRSQQGVANSWERRKLSFSDAVSYVLPGACRATIDKWLFRKEFFSLGVRVQKAVQRECDLKKKVKVACEC